MQKCFSGNVQFHRRDPSWPRMTSDLKCVFRVSKVAKLESTWCLKKNQKITLDQSTTSPERISPVSLLKLTNTVSFDDIGGDRDAYYFFSFDWILCSMVRTLQGLGTNLWKTWRTFQGSRWRHHCQDRCHCKRIRRCWCSRIPNHQILGQGWRQVNCYIITWLF